MLAENEQDSAADARELLRKVLELDGMVPTLTLAPWFPERTVTANGRIRPLTVNEEGAGTKFGTIYARFQA